MSNYYSRFCFSYSVFFIHISYFTLLESSIYSYAMFVSMNTLFQSSKKKLNLSNIPYYFLTEVPPLLPLADACCCCCCCCCSKYSFNGSANIYCPEIIPTIVPNATFVNAPSLDLRNLALFQCQMSIVNVDLLIMMMIKIHSNLTYLRPIALLKLSNRLLIVWN